jgi:hypothetical protein
MMQRRLQKSGFLCLPRRHMTKEFVSVAGGLILMILWRVRTSCKWLSDHPIWRVVIANLKEREIGKSSTINTTTLY